MSTTSKVLLKEYPRVPVASSHNIILNATLKTWEGLGATGPQYYVYSSGYAYYGGPCDTTVDMSSRHEALRKSPIKPSASDINVC